MKKCNKISLLSLLLVTFFSTLQAGMDPYVDLEEQAQDFILEVKKIQIPCFPHAFNPSIVRFKGLLLMSFRIIPDLSNTYTSQIGLIWMDDNFSPISEPQLIDTQLPGAAASRTDDGRLITLGDEIYLVYSDNTDPIISRGGFRVFASKLAFNNGIFELENPVKLSDFPGEDSQKREKNWVPFIYQDELLLSYSINPHLIFRPNLKTGSCETVAHSIGKIQWDLGELRGGTPAIEMDGFYLSFFHSAISMASLHSDGRKMNHYFMGAYTFSTEPPFALQKVSPQPLVGKGFYKGPIYKPYWASVRCVYPGGFVFDDQFIWIVYGRQDHEVWVCKLNKKALLESLVPVIPK